MDRQCESLINNPSALRASLGIRLPRRTCDGNGFVVCKLNSVLTDLPAFPHDCLREV